MVNWDSQCERGKDSTARETEVTLMCQNSLKLHYSFIYPPIVHMFEIFHSKCYMEEAMLMWGTCFSTGIGRSKFSMLDYIDYTNVIFHKRVEFEQDLEITVSIISTWKGYEFNKLD